MAICNICLETINKNIICSECKYEMCHKCTHKYFLTTYLSKCPNCKNEWSLSFIRQNTSKIFYDKYREHKINIIYEREKSLLPSLQKLVTHIKNTQTQIDDIMKENITLKLENKQRYLDNIILIKILKTSQQVHKTIFSPEKTFNFKCPENNCIGFVIENNCGLCKISVCDECHCKREQGHVCDQNYVDTLKLIETDSKKCPSCNILITKIDGCDQMWCLKCHTSFDWKTLEIINKEIHNPHYIQWKNTRKESPNIQELIVIIRNLQLTQYDIAKYHKTIGMMRNLLYQYPEVSDNMELRLEYLLNKITEKQWKINLKKKEKKKEYNVEICKIINSLINNIIDVLWKIYNNKENRNECLRFICEIEHTRTQYNQEINALYKNFNYKIPILNVRWQIDYV